MTRSIISHENVAGQEFALKGPKHEIFESEFFYTSQTCTGRRLGTGEKSDIS
jgi:hypothetical protein